MPNWVLVRDAKAYAKRFGDAQPFDGQGLYDCETGAKDTSAPKAIAAPYVQGDIPDHIGPNGERITTRAQQRELFRKGFTIYEPPKHIPRGYTNERFTQKRGLKINGAAKEYEADVKAKKVKLLAEYDRSQKLLTDAWKASNNG